MKKEGRLHRILLLTVIFAMLMAGTAMAASLAVGNYNLSSKGYIAWSDFNTSGDGYVTVNVSTQSLTGLTQRTLSHLTYQIIRMSGKKEAGVVGNYTRYGANRYKQVNSSKTLVNDRLTVKLPAGSYRFKVLDTEAVAQPVKLSYTVSGSAAPAEKPEPALTLAVSPLSLTEGQIVKVAMKNNKGTRVAVTGNRSSNRAAVWTRRSGTDLIIGANKAGTSVITVKYLGNPYTFSVTVVPKRPEFKAYIRSISSDRKYMYVRIYNAGTQYLKFFSVGSLQYRVSGSDSNTAKTVRLAQLQMVGRKSIAVAPSRWVTVKLKRTQGLFPSRSRARMEVWLRFRFNNTKYTAGIEDNWLDGQYRLRKKTSTWYPAYSARNNFS